MLVINREMVKVGKGAAHAEERIGVGARFHGSEGADRYLAATSMSGPNEALFFEGFPTPTRHMAISGHI